VNILDRYLYRVVLVYTAMAMAVLLTLGALFLFISQQSDIGVGSYSAGDAFLFTMLNLPQQAFELLPIGALIGALMGLGHLASGSELVVTRASGVSVWRIAWPVGLAGLTLAVIMYGIGDYAAPTMAQFAKREKTTLKLADVSFAGSSSAWVKDGNLILRVQTGEVDRAFGGVSLFQLDGFIAPDRSVSTVPPGDHREMSSKVVPKTVDWPNRPRANRGRKARRPTAFSVSADLTRPASAWPTLRKRAELKITQTSVSRYASAVRETRANRLAATSTTSAVATLAATCTRRRLAMITQVGAGVTRRRWKIPFSRSLATVIE